MAASFEMVLLRDHADVTCRGAIMPKSLKSRLGVVRSLMRATLRKWRLQNCHQRFGDPLNGRARWSYPRSHDISRHLTGVPLTSSQTLRGIAVGQVQNRLRVCEPLPRSAGGTQPAALVFKLESDVVAMACAQRSAIVPKNFMLPDTVQIILCVRTFSVPCL